MASEDNARVVLTALAAAEEELRRLITERDDAQIAELRTKIEEQVRKVAALRQPT